MIEKNKLKQILDHVLHPYKKEVFDNNIMHSEREWVIGVIVGLAVAVAGGLSSVHFYKVYSEIDMDNFAESEVDTVVYHSPLIEKGLEVSLERQMKYEALSSRYISAVVIEAEVIENEEGEAEESEKEDDEAREVLETEDTSDTEFSVPALVE